MPDRAGFDVNNEDTLIALSSDGLRAPVSVWADPTTHRLHVYSFAGFSLPAYDYVALSQGSTTDVYTFYTGGSGGTLVATITITYTDSGKGTIANVAKT